MSKNDTSYKLDMKTVLSSIDRQDIDFYNKLTDEEKKAYSPFVIMRYMSSLANNSSFQKYAILATNDLVNIGFGDLSHHKELQHLLLCCAGTGTSAKQYRPWIPVPKGKKGSNTIEKFLRSVYPEYNSDEIDLVMRDLTVDTLDALALAQGYTEKQIRELTLSLSK